MSVVFQSGCSIIGITQKALAKQEGPRGRMGGMSRTNVTDVIAFIMCGVQGWNSAPERLTGYLAPVVQVRLS